MAKKKGSTPRQATGGRPGFGSFLASVAADPFPTLPQLAPTTAAEDLMRAWRAASLPNQVAALRKESEGQGAELAALRADHKRLKAEVKAVNELPTLHDFTYKIQQLTQKRAAGYLRCTPRTIRNLIQKGKLTKTKNGKVQCDDKWAREVRDKYPKVRVK